MLIVDTLFHNLLFDSINLTDVLFSFSLQSLLGNPVLKSGLISGSLTLVGDLLAQFLSQQKKQSATLSYDPVRTARMSAYGLFFYGPYQHYWYTALESTFPGRVLRNFVSKLAMNQFCLAPVVITASFLWNLAWQGHLDQLKPKFQNDFVPTLLTGWKFWVPAASINFLYVPLQHQVLYMSACGIVWTAILSSSSTSVQSDSSAAPAPVHGGRGKSKNN